MKTAVRRATAGFAVAATAGVSTLVVGVAPAQAATEACGDSGTLIAPGVCEQVYTSGAASLTVTPAMTKLEVLLVGGGGSGGDQPSPNTQGYATGGGGGEVKVVDFSGTSGTEVDVVVGAAGASSSASDGSSAISALPGADGSTNSAQGGSSGGLPGNPGFNGSVLTGPPYYGAGGGAAASPTVAAPQDGGAGRVVNTLALSAGSLFATDTRCFGGGGAIGLSGGVQGLPGCGGGSPTGTGALNAPTANSGGGGGGLDIPQSAPARAGASGVVIARWTAANVTLSFNANGHGSAPASQVLVAGAAATQPAAPTAEGYEFIGWFTDPGLTTLADFSTGVTGSTTYYAGWRSVLPSTGSTVDAVALTSGLLALLAGAGLIALGRRRRPTAD